MTSQNRNWLPGALLFDAEFMLSMLALYGESPGLIANKDQSDPYSIFFCD